MKRILLLLPFVLFATPGLSETTVIDRGGGDKTTVNTNSRGDHQVIHSTGGGGQYGSGRTHQDVVRDQRPGKMTTTK